MNKPLCCQTRRGTFTAHVIPRGQCGFAAGQQTFNYEVEVCTRQLNDNGFVADNRDLDRLFDTWTQGAWQASCEDLAAGGICKVLDLMGDRAESVTCKVSPNGYADLAFWWARGDERPEHCPVRVKLNHFNHGKATTVAK